MRNSFLFALSLLFSLFSCSDNAIVYDFPPNAYPIEKGDSADRTMLVYIMAENSLGYYAASDVEEIKRGVRSLPSDCRVFAFIDDCGMPRIEQYVPDKDGLVNTLTVKEYDGDFCSSSAEELAGVLEFILEFYPTKSLDLVLWSHADGWLRGSNDSRQRSIGIDNGRNVVYSDVSTGVIEIEELAKVLETLPLKVERLMFDACLMQCVEVTYALRNSAEYIIASPAEIPAKGAPYDLIVPLFFNGESGASDIIEAYKVDYDNESAGVVLSVVSTAAMQKLADVTRNIVNKYFPVEKRRSYIDVFSYVPGGRRTLNKVYPCYFDMNAVMKKYLSHEDYAVWYDAFAAAVPYLSASDKWYSSYVYSICSVKHDVCGGLSIYMPQETNAELNSDFSATSWYLAAGWDVAGW